MVRAMLKKKDSVLYSWFLSYVVVLLVPILTGVFLYNSAYSVIKETTGEVYASLLDQAALEMDNEAREGNAILGQLLGDEDVQRLTSVKRQMRSEDQLLLISMTGRLQKLVMNHPAIEDIYIMFGDSRSVVSTKGHMSGDLFSELYLEKSAEKDGFKKLFDELKDSREIVNIRGRDNKDKLLFHKKTLDTGLGHSTAIIVLQLDEKKLMQRIYEDEDIPFFSAG